VDDSGVGEATEAGALEQALSNATSNKPTPTGDTTRPDISSSIADQIA
jgi:hypothetical protein